ncbi:MULTISPECIES: hypothetical protein [unclassified Microbacterium]|uniref:hypothetical protein n=1 Tax=unclassified Microbacterium TaxID=2609290 RepID=UPI0010F4A412|nr:MULTISPECIES: hypothetical protein [unclassified Microbacterium]
MPLPYVYDLTHLTGRRKNDERRWVVMTFEVRRRTAVVIGMSLVLSAFPTLLLLPFLGPFALITPVIAVTVGLALWEGRQRRGMKLRNWQAILDKRNASNGTLFAAGEVMGDPVLVMHQPTVIPLEAPIDINAPDAARPRYRT